MLRLRSLSPLLAVGLVLGAALPAGAAGFGLFQHGGRATAEAGAFVARASDPSAVSYNPAAIAHLDGLELEIGLDFNNATETYQNATAKFEAHHVINFPPAVYATWTPGKGNPWALGIGVDSPFWSTTNWDPALFPGRFTTRRFELQLFEVHPVVAYDLGDGWSVGGGLRYLYGTLRQGVNGNVVIPFVPAPGGAVTPVPVEIASTTDSRVDAFAFDLGLHYRAPEWGFGATLKSGAKLKGSGDATFDPRDVPATPGLAAAVAARTGKGSAAQSFELPWEGSAGLWIAPYPELRLELDATLDRWSGIDDTSYTLHSAALGTIPVNHRRDWRDTLNLRLGLEGDVTDAFVLSGGLAYVPTPVPADRVEPGFARGNALVYAVGTTYNFPQLSFDLGYSFYDYQDRKVGGQELLAPAARGTYSSRDQIWAASVRWRF